jgi:putative endonuclease
MVRDAIQREKNIKKWPRPWKLALIERMNPEWRDLYADLA